MIDERRSHTRGSTTTVRRIGAASALVLVAALIYAGSTAWACVPQPILSIEPLASALPGARFSVAGERFSAGVLEVRWNGLDGPLLAGGSGPSIHAEVAVPEVPPGLYTVFGFNRGSDGTVGVVARSAFEVLGRDTAVGTTRSAKHSSSSSWPAAAGLLGAGFVLAIAGFLAGRGRRRSSAAAPAPEAIVVRPSEGAEV